MPVLNSLVPIIAVIALGALLRWRGFLSAEATTAFNAFAYFWALPLFLFYKLAVLPSGAQQANMFVMTLLGATIVTLTISWLVSWVLRLTHGSRSAFMQASFRGNLAFFGLPLILFSLDGLGSEEATQLESAVLLALAPCVIFYNVAAVSLLSVYNKHQERVFCWKRVGRSIALNPLLLACGIGLIFQALPWQIPVSIERTCSVVGAAAFPLALLGIGSQLAGISFAGRWSEALWISSLKCLVCPAAGFAIGMMLGLRGIELKVVLILCAVPTAVSSYVLVDQMHGDRDLAAGAVVVGTVFSLLPLTVLLAI